MQDDGCNYTLIFNGEIYNYKIIKKELELRGHHFRTNSDTEVILRSYMQWKEDCLKRFRGMFAFAIFDKPDNKILIARDRFGIKPLYYSFYNNNFAFSSEVTPIIKSDLVPCKISQKALIDYHYFGSIQQPNTIYENIYSLMPASYMIINITDLKYSINKYYSFDSEIKNYDGINFKEASDVTRGLLEEATKYHLISDVEVGAFLSGGVDSTAVVALMAQYCSKPIKTFTIGFSKKTQVVDESTIAKYVAKFLKCEHHEIMLSAQDIPDLFEGYVRSLDQPSMDGFNTYIVSKSASKFVKVALSGLGGDEIFAGYSHFDHIAKQTSRNPNIIEKTMQNLHTIFPNRITRKYAYWGFNPFEATLHRRKLVNKLHEKDYRNAKWQNKQYAKQNHDLSPLQQITKAEIDNYLLNTLLRDSDVMSMAHSLELRPVLLDHVLVETAFALPDKYKISEGLKKAIFIDAVRDLVPEEVWKRQKTGFEMPYVSWLNDALNYRVIDAMNSRIALELFQPSYIKKINILARKGKLKRYFWKDFVLLEWLNKYGA